VADAPRRLLGGVGRVERPGRIRQAMNPYLWIRFSGLFIRWYWRVEASFWCTLPAQSATGGHSCSQEFPAQARRRFRVSRLSMRSCSPMKFPMCARARPLRCAWHALCRRVGASRCALFRAAGALYLLRQGVENRIDEIDSAMATQALLRNFCFFARDAKLVQSVFDGACEFVQRVPVRQLTFRKDAAVGSCWHEAPWVVSNCG